ncbi:MAG: CBS domain-containing protein [Alphaproteobacteria bacterium]
MIPRADIVGFPESGNVGDLARLMTTKGHSRIPVYRESLDDIVGVVHVIDLVKCLLSGKKILKLPTL